MKFACLIYNDATKLAGLSEADQLAAIVAEHEAGGAWKAELEKAGHLVYCSELQQQEERLRAEVERRMPTK